MKNLVLMIALFCISAAQADATLDQQNYSLERDAKEYLFDKCSINSADLWFVHTCKDIAWEAEKILNAKGYHFESNKISLTLNGPMKSVLADARITSLDNPDLNLTLDVHQMVGKVVSSNITDTSGSKYLVLSLVSPSLDLITISSTRIGKQGATKDMFCQNSYIMARKYLDDLKKIPTCKAVTELNDL